MSPWYTRQDRDRDHDSVRVRVFALEALEQLKASFAVVSESALVLDEARDALHHPLTRAFPDALHVEVVERLILPRLTR